MHFLAQKLIKRLKKFQSYVTVVFVNLRQMILLPVKNFHGNHFISFTI